MSIIAGDTPLTWRTFPGYARADGSAGVRNHLLVLSTVALTNRLAELAAAGDDDAVLVTGDFLRGLRGGDQDLQERVLAQLVMHPNVGAALVICHDQTSLHVLERRFAACGKPVRVLALMAFHGMGHAVEGARKALGQLREKLAPAMRTDIPAGRLTVALECGGSDATSALAANPSIGRFVDQLLAAGGTAIVSETAEFVGAEDVVRTRAKNEDVADRILACLARSERRLSEDGENYRGVNPTPENIEAGLTTLVEKTMGAVAKTGSCPFDGCLDFAEPPPGPGLYFMDTPFFSPVSITGMVAAGAQMTLFAVGVFNPSANPLAPTLKVCGNPHTLKRWADSLDVDVSSIIIGQDDLAATGERVSQAARQTAGGRETKSENWREGQVIIPKTCPLL